MNVKYKGFTSTCNPLVTQFRNSLLTNKTKLILYQNDGRERGIEKETKLHEPKNTHIIWETWWMGHGYLWFWPLFFFDDVMADGRSRINSDMFGAILSDHTSQWPHITVLTNNYPEYMSKTVQELSKANKWNVPKRKVSQPKWACFLLTADKTKGRRTHKQAASEGGCTKGLPKHLKGGNPAFGDIYRFQTSGGHWPGKKSIFDNILSNTM